MTRTPARLGFVIALLGAVVPAATARAQDGGGAAAPQPGGAAAMTDGSYAIAARPDALLGRNARFRGFVPTAEAGRTVTVERFEPITAGWLPVAATVVGSDGTFVALWQTDHVGRFRLRARIDRSASEATAAAASPEIGVTVYRPAVATWYGPGLYGRRTACGQRMTRRLLGVAHKRLPCGTQVAFLYGGRTLTVPVVDRGPFPRGREWDLTAAAAKALNFTFTDRVGAVTLR